MDWKKHKILVVFTVILALGIVGCSNAENIQMVQGSEDLTREEMSQVALGDSEAAIETKIETVVEETSESVDISETVLEVEPTYADYAFEITIEELAPLYHKAEELWDTYGVLVLVADKVNEYRDGAEMCLEYDRIERCLNLIESCLACYPENFFRNLSSENVKRDVWIQLVGTGSSAGLYLSGYNHLIIQIDVNCYNPEDGYDDQGSFFSYTLHHEIFHMINELLMERADYSECPLTEERWSSYNPEGFEYVNGYDDEKETELYCANNNFEYFVYSYSCSSANEDRAIIFGNAMTYYQGYERTQFTNQVNAKLKYLGDCIRAGFPSDDWEDMAPWDYMLN